MFYKVLKDNKVIDVLDKLIYLKWEPKHKTMILTDENNAQAILSSDKNTIWHEKTLYNIPVSGYDTVELVEISNFEYEQRKILKLQTPEEIIDAFLSNLISEGVV